MKLNVWMYAEWRMTIAVMCVSVWAGMSGVSPFAPTVSRATDDLAKSAATVEEVAKVLDLETLPIPEGATVTGERQLGALAYATTADLTSALEFQRKQFLKLGWGHGAIHRAIVDIVISWCVLLKCSSFLNQFAVDRRIYG